MIMIMQTSMHINQLRKVMLLLVKKTKLLHIHLQRILLIPYKLYAGTLDAETGAA